MKYKCIVYFFSTYEYVEFLGCFQLSSNPFKQFSVNVCDNEDLVPLVLSFNVINDHGDND